MTRLSLVLNRGIRSLAGSVTGASAAFATTGWRGQYVRTLRGRRAIEERSAP